MRICVCVRVSVCVCFLVSLVIFFIYLLFELIYVFEINIRPSKKFSFNSDLCSCLQLRQNILIM